MKWFLSFFAFLCILMGVITQESNFTFTYEMASRCKEHICQRGYSYDTYYSVYAEDRKNFNFPDRVTFEMHIAIQAGSNGHILLSSVAYPEHNDPVYEIVVGGGGNKFTELRRNLKRNAKASSVTVGILSAVELRGFYIRIRDSLIEFGKEGAELPIIQYFDVNPLDIRYFSFAAWNGVEAKFLYDCPLPGEGANVTMDSKEIKRKLSGSEQLKEDLLKYRNPNTAPGPNVNVSVQVNVTGLKYNVFEAKLTTRLSLITSWTDQSLAWEPSKFDNVTSVTYRQGQIWRPVFQVYNSDNLDALKTIGHEQIWMYPDGTALFHSKATIDTWCFTETSKYNRWPHDSYTCSIVIQPWEAHEKITLSGNLSLSRLAFTFQETLIENEWEVERVIQFIVPAKKWYRMYPQSRANTTHQGDRLVLNLDFQRKPTNYNIVFYTPLLVLVTFVLISFWSEPLQMSRVWFYTGATVLICMGLCYIDYLMPCHTIPTILVLYITVLGGILIALLVHAIMMTSVSEKLCKTAVMQNLLSALWFRALFCLPVMKICINYNTINEGYSTQDEDDLSPELSQRNGNVEEMQTDATKYCEKEELAEALDKIMFVVYSVVFAVMLGLHY